MKTKERIELNDTTQSALIKMAEGNPGALVVMSDILKRGEQIDPDNFAGGLGTILSMDSLGIYGSRIWMLHKDVCEGSLPKMLALLRSVQLGFLSGSKLNHAIDNYGEGIDIPSLVEAVQKRLPRFQV